MYTSCDLEMISSSGLEWTCPQIVSLLMLDFLGKFYQNCYFHSNQELDKYGGNCGEKRSIDIPNESILEGDGMFWLS